MEKELILKIQEKYNLDFVSKLSKTEGLKTYAFGGVIRDFVLNRDWKEVDVRITIDLPIEEREYLVESLLAKEDLQGKTRIENIHLTVYRFLPKGSITNEPIDLSVVPTLDQNLPDFTINSVFYDLVNKTILDRFGGLNDLKNKIIKVVGIPEERFKNEPHMMFRAIKFACQLGFEIANGELEFIKNNARLVRETFQFISEAKKGIFVELFLGNIFKGLKSDPARYFEYINGLGIYDQFIEYFAGKFNLGKNRIIYPTGEQEGFEDNISYLFSCITKSLMADNRQEVFNNLVSDLAITTPKDYSDFVIDIRKIIYQE